MAEEALMLSQDGSIPDLRIEARFRNNVLWHAIFDVSKSVAEFCRKHGLSQSYVGDLLNLKVSPYRYNYWEKKQRVTDVRPPRGAAKKVADAVGMDVEELFPRELYREAVFRLRPVAEVRAHQFLSLSETSVQSEAAQLGGASSQELWDERQAVAVVLSTLTPRQRDVIRLRFGFDGEHERTQRDVAIALGVSTSAVSQYERSAMKKLRSLPNRMMLNGEVVQLKERIA